MNFELMNEISELLWGNKLTEAIAHTEEQLNGLKPTPFHKLLGKNLLHHEEDLCKLFSAFYDKTKENLEIKAIYCEMNGFTINPDQWFVELFAYNMVGDMVDLDWLADWIDSSAESLVITGYEELQATYKVFIDNEQWKDKKLAAAADIAELLIVLRLQELVQAVKTLAKNRNLEWSNIPLFASAHEFEDSVYKIS